MIRAAAIIQAVCGPGCSAVHRSNTAKPHYYWWLDRLELLCSGFQKGNQDGDQQDVVAQGRLKASVGRGRLGCQHCLQRRPEGIGAGKLVDLR